MRYRQGLYLFLIGITILGCARPYKLSYESRSKPSPWLHHHGNPSGTGIDESGDFNGVFNVVWEAGSNDKPVGPLALSHEQLVYPGSKRKIRFYEITDGDYQGRIKVKGNPQTGMLIHDTLGIYALGPPKNRIECVNLRNRGSLWKVPLRDACPGSIIVKDRLIMSSRDGKILALAVEDGEVLWSFDCARKLTAPPTYGNDMVFQPSDDGTLIVFSLSEGTEIYRIKVDGPMLGAVVADEMLYGTDMNGGVYGINLDNGRIEWKTNLSGPIWTSPALADDRLVVSQSNGDLVALDASSGQILWQVETTETIKVSPLIGDNCVVVGTMAGTIFSFSGIDGRLIDSRELDGAIAFMPITDGKNIYVATQKGSITCFGENNANNTNPDQ